MLVRRRRTACWQRAWRSAASPAATTWWSARRGLLGRTARTSIRALRWPSHHAACYMTHAPIEAARKLREQHDLVPEQIARIRLSLDETCDRVCNIPAPRTGLEAKFSLRLTTAMALAGVDTGGLGSYSEHTAADPTLIALRDKVEFDFQPGRPNTIADLEVALTDGRTVTATHDSGI